MADVPVSYGLDMAPTHGALVRVEYGTVFPVKASPVGHYPGDWPWGLKPYPKGHEPEALTQWARAMAQAVHHLINGAGVVNLDYSVQGTAFMPSGRLYGVKWSLAVGAFIAEARGLGVQVRAVAPTTVRAFFRLRANAKKETVWEAAASTLERIMGPEFDKAHTVRTSDQLDALILAIVGGP
jgi:hypothetical protein